jgi:hypothetical protein
MRARGRDDVAPGAGAAFGLREGVVGIGDDDARRVARLAGLPVGDVLWTRDADGWFFRGRVAEGACRRASAAVTRATGLTHVRPAAWEDAPRGDDDVPAAVAASFARGGRNLQRIRALSA